MPLIECILGHAETPVGGETYHFQCDAAGRYVATVYQDRHVECLISSGTYREVDPLPSDFQLGDAPPAPITPPPDGISKPALLNGTALLTALNEASAPRLDIIDGKTFVMEPWPERIAVASETLAEPIDVLTVAEDRGTITITVENGGAIYALLGATEREGLYSLADHAFAAPPEPEPKPEAPPTPPVSPPVSPRAGSTPQPTPVAKPTKPAGLIDVKGIGPAIVKTLEERGIDTLGKLVALDADARKALDAEFKGGPSRDDWFGQAEILTKGA